jgi:hypothetical protein
MNDAKALRLIAETPGDLEILSAAIQDSVVKAGNLKFDAKARRFSLEFNRFRWEKADGRRKPKERVRSLLAFDGVLGVKTRAISKADPDLILSLLKLEWTADAEPPSGKLTLLFSGDGELVLNCEMLEATLLDSDYVWPTRNTPDHEKRRR